MHEVVPSPQILVDVKIINSVNIIGALRIDADDKQTKDDGR